MAVSLVGCATSTSPTGQPPATPIQAQAQTSPQAGHAAGSGAQGHPDSGAAKAASAGEFAPPPGFRARTYKGQRVYCRSEVLVGTRLARPVCYTQAEVEDIERRRRSLEDDISRSRRVCSTIEACAAQ